MAYRAYLTDALRVIGENMAKFSGGEYLKSRWIDLANEKPVKKHVPGEIAASVIKGAGLKVVI